MYVFHSSPAVRGICDWRHLRTTTSMSEERTLTSCCLLVIFFCAPVTCGCLCTIDCLLRLCERMSSCNQFVKESSLWACLSFDVNACEFWILYCSAIFVCPVLNVCVLMNVLHFSGNWLMNVLHFAPYNVFHEYMLLLSEEPIMYLWVSTSWTLKVCH